MTWKEKGCQVKINGKKDSIAMLHGGKYGKTWAIDLDDPGYTR